MKSAKPELNVKGVDGNSFMLLAQARRVALKNHMNWLAIEQEAKSGDYDHLVQTLLKYFEVTYNG